MSGKNIQNYKKKPDQQKKRPKSAPREMSTSKPCGAVTDFLTNFHQPKAFDPRFQDECGEIDHIQFVKNYSFLQENRQSEIEQIKKKLSKSSNPEETQNLKRKKQSLEDQYKIFSAKQKDVEDRFQWHAEERKRIMEGKKPFWLNKSSMKQRDEQRKFKELKESGKLNKYLVKRRKKLAHKDRLDLM